MSYRIIVYNMIACVKHLTSQVTGVKWITTVQAVQVSTELQH